MENFKDLQKYRIRGCDHEWHWDVYAGNSDALCNEDSSDPFCSVCDSKYNCKFANFPAQPAEEYNGFENYLEIINNREKKRNTDICEKCPYNESYDMVYLDSQEVRKYKLIELERRNKGKTFFIKSSISSDIEGIECIK